MLFVDRISIFDIHCGAKELHTDLREMLVSLAI